MSPDPFPSSPALTEVTLPVIGRISEPSTQRDTVHHMPEAVDPLSFTALVTDWTFDPVAALACAGAAGAYLAGVRRLARRSTRWRPARTIAFLSGIATIVIATQSGLGRYDTVSFSAHVTQHVMLGIIAPLLLALAAPVTLALQATTRPTQRNLLRVLRSRPAAVIGHPVTAWLVFGFTLFVLYFTPLYELSLRNDVVHAWVHIHFVVAGSLFAWSTIGHDPVPHRLPHGGRLLLVVLTVPFHAFLGLALLTTTEPLAAGWYTTTIGITHEAALADQRVGASIMWLVGDATALIVCVLIARQWWASEQRRTRHLDARLDAELHERRTDAERAAHQARGEPGADRLDPARDGKGPGAVAIFTDGSIR
jgi:cytochrome c oxidase assembly factor CtaG